MTGIEQGSAEWFAIRLGKVTASRVADIVARTKSGPSAMRANYAAQLVAERLTGKVEESYRSPEMDWGSETEADARSAYAFRHMAEVEEVGFVPHPSIAMAGASPDGLVGSEGLVEFKCPNTATHIDTLRGGSIPAKYMTQMQWQMACSGRRWCDFVSFDPRMPVTMQLRVQRVDRDAIRIVELEGEVRAFIAEVDATVRDLVDRYGGELRAAA